MCGSRENSTKKYCNRPPKTRGPARPTPPLSQSVTHPLTHSRLFAHSSPSAHATAKHCVALHDAFAATQRVQQERTANNRHVAAPYPPGHVKHVTGAKRPQSPSTKSHSRAAGCWSAQSHCTSSVALPFAILRPTPIAETVNRNTEYMSVHV
ncbi:hypothetical protein DQ04_11221010 [Trypanosoma grayi]|uniref:hypothetical protein n=1 Tax=Trypanosoma grayi TaxID=71804 RepID=UPI0004F4776C|nr:hypothetical protein DQ04_11221010 [Trypanosoma grayi]KEG07019.1 hypothetical protein DQ04_11221010 [Trypanosoma grayi]